MLCSDFPRWPTCKKLKISSSPLFGTVVTILLHIIKVFVQDPRPPFTFKLHFFCSFVPLECFCRSLFLQPRKKAHFQPVWDLSHAVLLIQKIFVGTEGLGVQILLMRVQSSVGNLNVSNPSRVVDRRCGMVSRVEAVTGTQDFRTNGKQCFQLGKSGNVLNQ